MASYPLPDDLAFDARMRAMVAACVTGAATDARGLKAHQAFVAAYLAPETPYRGLLLYHGLGTGKTRAAIAAAEPHARAGAPVFVMLPASLKRTFANEMRAAGATFPVTTVAYNGVSTAWIRRWTDRGAKNPLDGAFVIVDEVHNLTRALSTDDTVGASPSSRRTLYDLVVRAKGARVALLTGSPAVNRAHEVALAVNMVRGPACDHTLEWRRPLTSHEVRQTEISLRSCDSVLSSRVTATGATLRMAPAGFRAVAGSTEVTRQTSPRSTSTIPQCVVKLVPAGARLKPVCCSPFPESPESFETHFVGEAGQLIAPTVLARRCRGAVSVRDATTATGSLPKVAEQVVYTPLSTAQFGEYCRVRVLERRSEGRRGAKSVHRQYSRSVSNFVFPSADGIRKMYRSEAADDSTHDTARAAALVALNAHSMWTDDSVLARYSPKFIAALTAIDASPGPVMVYSAFRQLEGAGLFSRALDGRGWRQVTLTKRVRTASHSASWNVRVAPGADEAPRYIVPEPNTEGGALLVALFNQDDDALPDDLRREQQADRCLIRAIVLTRSGAEGLSLKGVRQVHILEPHWNGALSRQVAARAVRLGSHSALPEHERDVRVFTYVATFSEAQRKSTRFAVVAERDGGMTTDQHLLRVCAAKDARIDTVLEAVRGSAVDCGAWIPSTGCYVPPASEFGKDGGRPMMPVQLEADSEDMQRVVTDRVVRVGGRLMVVPEGENRAYDAARWAKGVRVPVGRVRRDGAVRLLEKRSHPPADGTDGKRGSRRGDRKV